MSLLPRRSYPRSDFRRLAYKSTCDASRLRGLYLRQAAFLRSGYSPRPKPLPSSNFSSSRFSLSRQRPPLSRSPSAHDVTRSVLVNMSIFRRPCSVFNCEAPDPQARPDETRSRPSCSTPEVRSSFDDRRRGRYSQLSAAPFGASSRVRSHRAHSRARGVAASCIFRCGALDAAILSRPRASFRMLEDAHDLFPPCDVPRPLDGSMFTLRCSWPRSPA